MRDDLILAVNLCPDKIGSVSLEDMRRQVRMQTFVQDRSRSHTQSARIFNARYYNSKIK